MKRKKAHEFDQKLHPSTPPILAYNIYVACNLSYAQSLARNANMYILTIRVFLISRKKKKKKRKRKMITSMHAHKANSKLTQCMPLLMKIPPILKVEVKQRKK